METTALSTNESHPYQIVKQPINFAEEILIYITGPLIMVSMGAAISIPDLKKHCLKPVGVSIGLFCQFIATPFLAFLVTFILSVTGTFGTGVLLVSCCPGGMVSNIFAYYVDGDLSLSVTMTTLSGAVALIAMPANLWLYGHYVETDGTVIPYKMIAISLASIVGLSTVGILIQYFKPIWALFVTKYGVPLAGGLVIAALSLNIYARYDLYLSGQWQLYVAVIVLPCIGFVASYYLTRLVKQPASVSRTIAIEASVQNVGLAITIARLSFTFQEVGPVLVYPTMYGVTMCVLSCIVIGIYRLMERIKEARKITLA